MSIEAAGSSKHHEDIASDSDFLNEKTENTNDVFSDHVLTLAIHEKLSLQTGPSKHCSNGEVASSDMTGDHDIPNTNGQNEVIMNGEFGSPESRGVDRKPGGKGSSVTNGSISFCFGPRGQDSGSLKV